jgi:hypothetical protein
VEADRRLERRLLGELGGLLEVRLAGRVADAQLDDAQTVEECGAVLGRRRLVERAPQERKRAVDVAARLGRLACLEQPLGDPRVGGRRDAQKVRAHLLGRRPRVVQEGGGTHVHERSRLTGDLLVHGVADERMAERQQLTLAQDVRVGEAVGGDGGIGGVELGERRRLGEHAAVTEHGDCARKGDRVVAEAGQTHDHGPPDGV